MTHADKVAAYRRLMASRGVPGMTAAPPVWELVWSLGLPLPPPLFMGPVALFLFCGGCFGCMFGIGAWFVGNRGVRSMSLHEAGLAALASGIAFGLAMAWYGRRLAARHRLGCWSTFRGSAVGR